MCIYDLLCTHTAFHTGKHIKENAKEQTSVYVCNQIPTKKISATEVFKFYLLNTCKLKVIILIGSGREERGEGEN